MQHSEHFKSLSEEAKEYIENRVELVRLEAMDHSSFLFANITAYIILAGTLLLFLISFCFFAGSWLGELLGSLWAGFAIIAGFYLILFLLLIWKFTPWVSNPIQNFLIQKMEDYHADED